MHTRRLMWRSRGPWSLGGAGLSVLMLVLSGACGSASGGGEPVPEPAPSGPAPSSQGGAPSASATGSHAAAGTDPGPPPVSTSVPSARRADAGPSSSDPVPVAEACAASVEDACGTCVCSECRAELDACLVTAGCPEILACVRSSGCSGRACYCGDASLPACISGQADGPCKDVVLAAPGGRAPDSSDLSGGPASDAAAAIADCAQANAVCRDVCGISD